MVELDFTKLKIPVKNYDSCEVLDVGSGAFPRYIEVRLPGADGARRTARWDGSINLAVTDKVICEEFPSSSVLRIKGVGGADSGTGKVRVSDVWESDFGAVALAADASGNLNATGHLSGDAWGFVAKNTSGATAAVNEIGYIDESGEYQTTTTQFNDVEWCVVLVGGANNADIYVARRGRVTVELDGNCSIGDKLYTSTTAGQANPQSYMRPEMFAIALTANASGAGGTCEALLHTNTRYVPKTSTSNVFRINSHSDTEFATTINGAPTATTVVYTTPLSSGAEDSIVPLGSVLVQQRLWNTTRNSYRLISSVDTGTNTITTVSSTDSWANTDVITIESQTATPSGAPGVYIELDFENAGSGFLPLARAVSFESFKEDSGAAGEVSGFHPLLSVSASRQQTNNNHGTGTTGRGYRLVTIPVIEQVFCYKSGGSGTGTAQDIMRLAGYYVASP